MFCQYPTSKDTLTFALKKIEAKQKLHTTPAPPSGIPAGTEDTNDGPRPAGGGGCARRGKIADYEFVGHEHEDPAADEPWQGNEGIGGDGDDG
jgi:hypothetical protein